MASKTKSKVFRVAVEGDTTDGRQIQRSDIEQMAASFNPSVYGARVWLEHMRGFYPDSTFRAYGDVTSVSAEEITDGELKGKLALYAEIDPTDDLVAMVKARQKIYTSIEIQPNFAKTGGSYLVGLAVTDSPASLGTEMLAFSANAQVNPLAARKQSPENMFTAAAETVIEFEEQEEKTSLFSKVFGLLQKSKEKNSADFSDVHKAVETVAKAVVDAEKDREKDKSEFSNQLAELSEKLEAKAQAFDELAQEFSQLKVKLSEEPESQFRQRTPATGGDNTIKTDC